jgi:hypothetical protein
MKDKYSQAAIRVLETSHRDAYGRLLNIACDDNNGAVRQLAATGEAIMLAAKLAKARQAILRASGQDS